MEQESVGGFEREFHLGSQWRGVMAWWWQVVVPAGWLVVSLYKTLEVD